jgi:hypothetical protein
VTHIVVLPGGRFGPAAGQLAYSAAVPERRGGTVIRHDWTPPVPDPFQPAAESWVDGADHGMMVPTGPLADSVTALGTVLDAIDTFLDAIGWQPEASRSTD